MEAFLDFGQVDALDYFQGWTMIGLLPGRGGIAEKPQGYDDLDLLDFDFRGDEQFDTRTYATLAKRLGEPLGV